MGKEKVALGTGLMLCLLAMALSNVLKLPETEEAQAAFATQGEWKIYTGLMAEEREKVSLSKLPGADDLWALVNEQHRYEGQPALCSVRKMVGSFLPVEGDVQLRDEVIYALCDIKKVQPLEEGIVIIRGHMGNEAQRLWQEDTIQRYLKVNRSREQAVLQVPDPGCSEHQTGWAVDIRLTGPLDMGKKDPLERNRVGRWLKENMHLFGFTYDICGEHCEDVHLRYVGRPMARVLQVMGLKLSDFLDMLEKEKGVTLMHNGHTEIYMQWLENGEQESWIPRGMPVRLSHDNRGHLILCATAE